MNPNSSDSLSWSVLSWMEHTLKLAKARECDSALFAWVQTDSGFRICDSALLRQRKSFKKLVIGCVAVWMRFVILLLLNVVG